MTDVRVLDVLLHGEAVGTLVNSKERTYFSRMKRFDRFSVSEISHLASKALLPRKLVLDAAGETVDVFHQKWRSEKTNLPLATNVVRAIEDHLRTIPIV